MEYTNYIHNIHSHIKYDNIIHLIWHVYETILEDVEILETEYYLKEENCPMNPTDPNIGYTISLNLEDDDLLLVQNMNEDEERV